MSNNESLNIDLQYFASVNWYKKVYQYKHIQLNGFEPHVKMSFRNRMWLAGADGLVSLSIPLLASRNERQLCRDVRLAPGRWGVSHFRTISSCYNRSPWFEHFRDELAEIYAKQFVFLWDWNLACFDWVNSKLALQVSYRLAEEVARVHHDEPIDDARNRFRPGNKEEWMKNEIPRYAQVFEDRTGFLPGLSILDLLFCEGPAGRDFLL